MSGHRFGRGRSIWRREGHTGESFEWAGAAPRHYCLAPVGAEKDGEWHPMRAHEAPPGKDVWVCTGCGHKVELEADSGKYGAHAPAPKPAGPPDFFSMHARKLLAMPEEWAMFRVEMKAGPGRNYFEVTGAICSATFKRGKWRGQKDWTKRDVATERTILIAEEDHRAFVADWERETWLCSKCGDSGQELASSSLEGGSVYRPCTRCVRMDDATRAQLAETAAQGVGNTLSHVLTLLPRRLLLRSRVDRSVLPAHEVLARVQPSEDTPAWWLAVGEENYGKTKRLLICTEGPGFIWREVAPGDSLESA